MHADQYSIVASRRQAYDTLLWQMPAIGIAAQSFLISASLDSETPRAFAIVLSAASCFVAFASVQFFQRLRFIEICDAELLRKFESENASKGFEVVHGRKGDCYIQRKPVGLARLGSYTIWNWLLIGFFALAFASFALAVARTVS